MKAKKITGPSKIFDNQYIIKAQANRKKKIYFLNTMNSNKRIDPRYCVRFPFSNLHEPRLKCSRGFVSSDKYKGIPLSSKNKNKKKG